VTLVKICGCAHLLYLSGRGLVGEARLQRYSGGRSDKLPPNNIVSRIAAGTKGFTLIEINYFSFLSSKRYFFLEESATILFFFLYQESTCQATQAKT
jgi:hypothetical protein